MANIEDLRDRSVSSGTLKSDDLIPKFLGVLKTYGKDKYDKYIKENPEVEDWENLDEETMSWVVDELTDLLNEIAPDGCYFGASEGDGADFGFWSMSNESKKNETNSPEEAVKKVLMDASADAEFRREAGKDFSAEDFEKSIDANIEKLRDVFLDNLYFDEGSFTCDVNDHEETRELCSFVASKVAYILGLPDSVATAIDGYLLWYVVQENIVSDESKKSESVSSMVKKILKDKPEVMLTDDAVNEYDDYDEMLDDLEGEQDYIHIGSNGNNEDMIFRYNADKNLIVVGDLDVDSADADAALSLVQDFVYGKLKLASSGEYDDNSDFIAIIDGMTYTAYVYIRGDKDESKKSEDTKVGKFTIMPKDTSRKQAGIRAYQTRLGEMGFKSNLHNNGDYLHDYVKEIGKIPGATVYVGTIDNFQQKTQEYQYEAELYMENENGIRSNIEYMPFAITDISDGMQRKMYFNRLNALIKKGTDFVNNHESSESHKKSESLTLKQKELKDLVRLGEAEDITAISDAEAKELKKKGIETIGVSRGTYGMNGALLRDYDGKKYAILARNGNLFYFV